MNLQRMFTRASLTALLLSAAVAIAGAQPGGPRVDPEQPIVGHPGLPGFVAMSGTLVMWGDDDFNQRDITVPNGEFKAIAAGGYHTLAILPGGSIVAWGDNRVGQCDVPAPNADFVAVCGGGLHSLGLKKDGSIVGWGRNLCGQCNAPLPNTGYVAIAAGALHSLALRSDGSIAAWGDNHWGQCNVPEPNADFVAVAAGYEHSLGLKADGSVVAWGRNDWGQCNVPEPNLGFVALAGGYWHSVGLRSDGKIVTWGCGAGAERCVPTNNEGFVAVAAGLYHNIAMRSDGSVVAWGNDEHLQCEMPPDLQGVALIRAGYLHNVALKPSGCVPVPMTLHLTPKDLNLRSGNGWLIGVLEPEPPFDPAGIHVGSVLINRTVPAEISGSSPIGDADRDGRPDLTVRFDRTSVVAALVPGDEIEVTVTGTYGTNGCFEATDVLSMKGTARPTPAPDVIAAAPVFALPGAVPNPGRALDVAFSLANAQPARLVVFDVSGRVVAARQVGALGAGRHVVSLAGPGTLPPGVYLVHLVQGERSLVARAVIVR